MDQWFGGKWRCRNNLLSSFISEHTKRSFDYVTSSFCGLLLDFVGDCTTTLSVVVAMLVHP